MAVEDASFSTVMFSMSFGFNQEMAPPTKSLIISVLSGFKLVKSLDLNGSGSSCITPSTTHTGSALPNRVDVPRTLTRWRVPVKPLLFITTIPGIFPCKACSRVCVPVNTKSSAFT